MKISQGDGRLAPIKEIYGIAGRYSRRQEEVDDLVQDLFLEALNVGKDFSAVHFMAWAHGYLRNRAAFIARTEGRRRKREEKFHNRGECLSNGRPQLPERFIVGLRPSLRIVARLANCGLNRKEVLYVLAIADTALRQRVTALRKEWQAYTSREGYGSEYADDRGVTLLNGLLRQSLKQVFKPDRIGSVSDRIVGSHDPDGHLFTIRFSSAHKKDFAGNNSH